MAAENKVVEVGRPGRGQEVELAVPVIERAIGFRLATAYAAKPDVMTIRACIRGFALDVRATPAFALGVEALVARFLLIHVGNKLLEHVARAFGAALFAVEDQPDRVDRVPGTTRVVSVRRLTTRRVISESEMQHLEVGNSKTRLTAGLGNNSSA